MSNVDMLYCEFSDLLLFILSGLPTFIGIVVRVLVPGTLISILKSIGLGAL